MEHPSAAAVIAQALGEMPEGLSTGGVKCGTSLLGEASLRWGELPVASRRAVESVLQRQSLQKSRLSSQAHFRVHYDTTGFRQPALLLNNTTRIPDTHEAYVDSVLGILEQVWSEEVSVLGYSAPPPDGVKGGGPEYDVYIIPQQSGLFGATYWEPDDVVSSSPTERYATYIEIDNDYAGYRTPGMDGLRVTAAHEFFHAIQVGSSGVWRTETKSDFYFYELASTWMEDVVYDEVNDYLFEVRDYLTAAGGRGFRDLQGRAYPFTTYGVPTTYYGYERCLFAHFLEAKFGRPLMRDIWRAMAAEPFLRAITSELEKRGTNLEREYAWFSFWNYYTADRADTVQYYPEGNLYPRLDPHVRMLYNGYFSTISTSGAPLSDQHFEFVTLGDTIHAIVANVDAVGASMSNPGFASLALTASTTPQGGVRQTLANGAEMSLAVERQEDWRALYVLTSTGTDARNSGTPSPNPLSLGVNAVLTIPIEGTPSATASVWLLSSSLDLVYSCELPVVQQFGRNVATLSSSELRSSVSSGIHFLVVRTGGNEFTWKIAIIQ